MFKPVAGLVEHDEGGLPMLRGDHRCVEREGTFAAASLESLAPTRMIDEHAAQRLGGHGHKVVVPLPVGPVLPRQPQVYLVDERGCLERVAGIFAGQLSLGELAKLRIERVQ